MEAGRAKKKIKSTIAVCMLLVLMAGVLAPEGEKAAAEAMDANFLKEVQAHNVTETADYNLQHSKGRGISQNLGTFTYQAPEVTVKYEFNNVAELKTADFSTLGINEGDYVSTKGYYSAGDSGQGVYRIQNEIIIRDDGKEIYDDGGQIIACDNQINKKNMRAVLQSADGVVSVAQYGAVGDGVTDDSVALEKAFSSNFSVIYLEKGKNYYCASTININEIKDMTIEGQGAILFADNHSQGEWDKLMILFGPENYCVKNIRFELRCTKYIGMTGLASMYNGNNFGFDHCEFYIPKGVYADSDVTEPTKTYASCCVGGYSNWSNIYINNCIIENYADTYTGGCIGFNDIWYQGSEGAMVDNCYMAYNCKDEIIAIFSGAGYESERETYINDVTIKNCDIYGLKGQYNRDLLLSIGYEYPIDNIQFINNHIEGYGVWKGISVGSGAGRVLLEGNEIVYSGISEKAEGNVINTGDGENAGVIVRNNKILVPSTSMNLSIIIAGIAEVSDNQIRCDAGTGYVMGYGTKAMNNQVMVNGSAYGLMCQNFQSMNNQFVINGECKGTSLYSVKEILKDDVVVNGDKVSLNGGVADSVKWLNALTVNKVTFQENEIQFTGNTIEADSFGDKKFNFFGYSQNTEQDTAKITISNNNIDSAFSAFTGDVTEVDMTFKNNKIEGTPLYLMNFVTNGRTTDSSRLVLSGNIVTLPNLNNVDDILLGWYTDKAFHKEFNASTPVTSNLTLYARWEGDPVGEEEATTEGPSEPPFTEDDIVDNENGNQGNESGENQENNDNQNNDITNPDKEPGSSDAEDEDKNNNQGDNQPDDSNQNQDTSTTNKPEDSIQNQDTPTTNKPEDTGHNQITSNSSKPGSSQNQTTSNTGKPTTNASNNSAFNSNDTQMALVSDTVQDEIPKEDTKNGNNGETNTEVFDSKAENTDTDNQESQKEKNETEAEENVDSQDSTEGDDFETLEESWKDNQKLIIGIIGLAGMLSFGILLYVFILIRRGK